jgi:hypothetical protein
MNKENAGLQGAQVEADAWILVIRLSGDEQNRLLGDDSLRREWVRQARTLGFSRLALELM